MPEFVFSLVFITQNINVRHVIIEVFVPVSLYVCSSPQWVEFPWLDFV